MLYIILINVTWIKKVYGQLGLGNTELKKVKDVSLLQDFSNPLTCYHVHCASLGGIWVLAPKLEFAQNPLFNKEHVSGLMFPKAQFGIYNFRKNNLAMLYRKGWNEMKVGWETVGNLSRYGGIAADTTTSVVRIKWNRWFKRLRGEE